MLETAKERLEKDIENSDVIGHKITHELINSVIKKLNLICRHQLELCSMSPISV